jgi:RHS repeat-associated protein
MHHDRNGSVRAVSDVNGQVIGRMNYGAFGEVRLAPGQSNRVAKFDGVDIDVGTGLQYMGARFYDPVLNRFISPDAIVPDALNTQATNRYAYNYNNPLAYTDPSGHEPYGVSSSYYGAPPPAAGFDFSVINFPGRGNTLLGGIALAPVPATTSTPTYRGLTTPSGVSNSLVSQTQSGIVINPSKFGHDPFGLQEGETPSEGRNWTKTLIGPDMEGVLSWAHGGSFVTGLALMSMTTFTVPFAAAGGIIADAFTLPLKGMEKMPGCITCEVLSKTYPPVYKVQFEYFIEPSFPWQMGEAVNEFLESRGLFPPAPNPGQPIPFQESYKALDKFLESRGLFPPAPNPGQPLPWR